MSRNSIGLKAVLLALTCVVSSVASLPTIANEARGGRRKAWKLPKTDQSTYKGRVQPPTYTAIPIGKLNAAFGDVVTVEPTPASGLGLNITVPGLDERDIIGTDDRTVLKNSAYPWSAIGRLLWSDGTYCTASLVGDRFVLTASHCIPWDKPSISIVFQPGFYDSEVFGHYQVTDVAYIRKNDLANFDSSACGVYYDYSIMKLDTAISSKVGTLGVTQWNSTLVKTALTTVGYPLDVGAGAKPYTQSNIIAVTSSTYQCLTDGPLMTKADSASGQSGGPLFIPATTGTRYIVGTLSASDADETDFASGAELVSLTAWGKTNWAS